MAVSLSLLLGINHDMMNTQYLDQISDLLDQMTLSEKIGQLSQFQTPYGQIPENFKQQLQNGDVGSVLNEADLDTITEMQRIAVEESRLGIPLLFGRDVIHGFKTVFPIPLGQAATWSETLVEQAARVSAIEARSSGINWTFSPMIDISRDPRWGRIAESFGEDHWLTSKLGNAMVDGYQTDNLKNHDAIAACAKHFVGYGAAESGRDYNSVNICENELRNVYLTPFKSACDNKAASMMAAFNDLNGVPASGNEWLMQDVLRTEWGYDGVMLSDWDSIRQLSIHGFTENDKASALAGINAGIDMEMVSTTYADHIEQLLSEGKIKTSQIDTMVKRILLLKFKMGLFDAPYTASEKFPELVNDQHRQIAKEVARNSCVLLQNKHNVLPLAKDDLSSVALIGPLADDGYEQLGTWIFDGDEQHSVTCLQALKAYLGNDVALNFAKGLATSRTTDDSGFNEAITAVKQSDVAVLVLGEESILSGEAHCRTNLDLPGAQHALIRAIKATGTPIVLVVMAGRPLTLTPIMDDVDAILYAWHPGTMGGEAIKELIFGEYSPTGKLPVSFPRNVGQIPIYYNQKHTGKPVTDDNWAFIDDIPVRAEQTSMGMNSAHIDCHFTPLFPFGFGLTYGELSYQNLQVKTPSITPEGALIVDVELVNDSQRDIIETAQLYIRDLHASVTRPVRELKAFKRVEIKANSRQPITFILQASELSFYNQRMQKVLEPGLFHCWIGGDSQASLQGEFRVI